MIGLQELCTDTFQHQGRRATGATLVSIALHGLLLAAVIAFFTIAPQHAVPRAALEFPELLFVAQPGPGGDGGGSPVPAPPQPVAIPRNAAPEPVPLAVPEPTPAMPKLPVVTTPNTALQQASGSAVVSLAPYGGDGEAGNGIGLGRGDGVGDGERGGFGGGPPGPGNGITTPTILRNPNPTYTSEAMRAKITGAAVLLEVIVRADGTVGDVRVLRSLDRGLDQEAIKAAKLWLFAPARNRAGTAVAVTVQIELAFRLH